MPTLVAQPWPSGPVVVSTPAVRPIFRMTGAVAAELAETLDVVERHRACAGVPGLGVDTALTPARCSIA